MFTTFRDNSSAVECMSADALRGKVAVKFSDDKFYVYFNVSRRAIFNFIMQPNMSVGFWINENLLNAKRVECYAW